MSNSEKHVRNFVISLIDFVTDLERVYPYEEPDIKNMDIKEQIEISLMGVSSVDEESYNIFRYGKHIKKEKRHPKTLLVNFKKFSYDNYVERYEQVLTQIQKKKQLRKIYLLPNVNFGKLTIDDDTRIAICAHLKKLYKMVDDIWKAYNKEVIYEMSDSDSDIETSDEEGELVLDKEFLTECTKSLLMDKTDNPDLSNLINDTVSSVTDTVNNDEEIKNALNSMKGVGDIFKLLANDKFSNMMEGLANSLGNEYTEKVKRGEANGKNLMKAGKQISDNVEKNLPSGVKDILREKIRESESEFESKKTSDVFHKVPNLSKRYEEASGEEEGGDNERKRQRRKRTKNKNKIKKKNKKKK